MVQHAEYGIRRVVRCCAATSENVRDAKARRQPAEVWLATTIRHTAAEASKAAPGIDARNSPYLLRKYHYDDGAYSNMNLH